MKQYILHYFSSNIVEYLKLLIIFVIGIVVSIFVINNSNNVQKEEIKEYVDSRIISIKDADDIDKNVVFQNSINRNLKEFVIISFLATTIIGLPIAYLLVFRKAFSVGYTISAIFATQNIRTAIIFICNTLVLHNIIYLIAIFTVLVAGSNFVKNLFFKKSGNIKFEIIRYFIFAAIGVLLIIISSLLEGYFITTLLKLLKKYL